MNTSRIGQNEIKQAIQRLQRRGDALERHIAAIESLAPIVHPYAAVWERHVQPRRDATDHARWPEDWLPFVAAHYTALVRLANTHHNHLRLSALCKSGLDGEFAAARLLQIHNAISCYKDNIRGAIVALRTAFGESPVGRQYKSDGTVAPATPQPTRHAAEDYLLPTWQTGEDLEVNGMVVPGQDNKWRLHEKSLGQLRREYRQHWGNSLAWLAEAWWSLFAGLETQLRCDQEARNESLAKRDLPSDGPRSVDWRAAPCYPQLFGPGVGV